MTDLTNYKPPVGLTDYPTKIAALVDALAKGTDPFGRSDDIINLSLVFTVAANALTCNVKARDGSAPSANSPVTVAWRNLTLTSGDFSENSITAALSLTVSSGSTLGHASAKAGDLYWYIINGGGPELAVSSKFFGEAGICSTTAEGGAGAADTAGVMYSVTARTNVSYRCIGRTVDTQTTAGTWTAVPTVVELWPFTPKLNIKTGTFTRDQATASGTQQITGVGFEADVLLFFANQSSSSKASVGADAYAPAGATAGSVANAHGVSANTWATTNSFSVYALETGANSYAGIVTAKDADSFTINWTRTGTPTGTLTINYVAISTRGQ